METLLDADASKERTGKTYECDDYDDFVPTYKVKPPTDRLRELYDDEKLAHVLEGMVADKLLPAMKVKFSSGGPFDYEVVDGIHRYYASVKRGYAKLPVVLAG
jgi:ParB-like chromosome segregation protein Spo0J